MRSKAIQEEATRLIRDYGVDAYNNAREAMRLARAKKNARLESYFAKVAQQVARDSGREIGVDTATRYLNPGHLGSPQKKHSARE
jgi:hypothetical protein